MTTINAFLALTSDLKALTTKKRIAKAILGSRHPFVVELRAAQRALRAQREKLAAEEGLLFVGQNGGTAMQRAHGVDVGAFVELCLKLQAEGGEGGEE